MTLHMVVLVWFTGILSEYAYALMIAENIELKQLFNLNSYPFADQSLKLGCHKHQREALAMTGQRLTMSLVGLPIYTIWGQIQMT